MRLLKDSKVWIIIKTFRSCKKFYNQAFSNTFLIRKLQWALVLGQLTFVYSEQVLLAFRLRAGSVILLILANNGDPAQLFEKKGIHHYLRAPSQDSGDGSVHVFDFLLWYEEYYLETGQNKTCDHSRSNYFFHCWNARNPSFCQGSLVTKGWVQFLYMPRYCQLKMVWQWISPQCSGRSG